MEFASARKLDRKSGVRHGERGAPVHLLGRFGEAAEVRFSGIESKTLPQELRGRLSRTPHPPKAEYGDPFIRLVRLVRTF